MGSSKSIEPSHEKNNLGFRIRSDTYQSVLSQKRARSLKICILVEELYSPCSKNKVADQLCCNCTADLCLCFGLCMLMVFLCGGSNLIF